MRKMLRGMTLIYLALRKSWLPRCHGAYMSRRVPHVRHTSAVTAEMFVQV